MPNNFAESTTVTDALPVYPFDHPHDVAARDLADLLGGKGAGLAEMTVALDVPVPPGFTITLPVCRAYRESGWPDGLDAAIDVQLEALERRMGRRFGDAADPLLVAVRSGAPISMPGMLDTVLNLGLNEATVAGLAQVSGDESFAWDSYRRFIVMYATTVMGVSADALEQPGVAETADDPEQAVSALLRTVAELAGRAVPEDPRAQLREAIEAVFRSWDSERAKSYRSVEKIDESMGTAVNVQAMVFGNRGADSGTGVVFTRDPSTGEARLYGDYLPQAQGEDVVAGTAHTMPIEHLSEHQPEVYAELVQALRRLEVHYRDICDVEFTVEDGRLWMLQTRVGKRGAVAAVRIAVDLVNDPEIALGHDEALERAPEQIREQARQAVLARDGHGQSGDLLCDGLGASAGRATGAVVLSGDAAADADGDVILVRRETSPEDVAGMAVAAGVLTTSGGLVSHAAVVARGWGLPAVVGAKSITWAKDKITIGDRVLHEGDVITIDGTSGCVWVGEVSGIDGAMDDVIARELPALAELDRWAAESDTGAVAAALTT